MNGWMNELIDWLINYYSIFANISCSVVPHKYIADSMATWFFLRTHHEVRSCCYYIILKYRVFKKKWTNVVGLRIILDYFPWWSFALWLYCLWNRVDLWKKSACYIQSLSRKISNTKRHIYVWFYVTYVGLCLVNILKRIDFGVIDQIVSYSGRDFSLAFLQWSPDSIYMSKSGRIILWDMWHPWEPWEMCTQVWSEQ
jgi:hypothetical protein